MDPIQSRRYLQSLTLDGKGLDSQPGAIQWQDPCHIATYAFRWPAIKKLSRETVYDPTETVIEGAHPGVALVEIYLTEPLPGVESFRGIFQVDDLGIWYGDNDQNIDLPVWQQRVIPWRYIKGLVLHQRS